MPWNSCFSIAIKTGEMAQIIVLVFCANYGFVKLVRITRNINFCLLRRHIFENLRQHTAAARTKFCRVVVFISAFWAKHSFSPGVVIVMPTNGVWPECWILFFTFYEHWVWAAHNHKWITCWGYHRIRVGLLFYHVIPFRAYFGCFFVAGIYNCTAAFNEKCLGSIRTLNWFWCCAAGQRYSYQDNEGKCFHNYSLWVWWGCRKAVYR